MKFKRGPYRKKDEEPFEIIWEQVSSPDADLRIQRAFEMLLNEPDRQSEEKELC